MLAIPIYYCVLFSGSELAKSNFAVNLDSIISVVYFVMCKFLVSCCRWIMKAEDLDSQLWLDITLLKKIFLEPGL